MTKTAALIVAAGRGTRAGGDIAKQWRALMGRRVLDWTIDRFLNQQHIDHVMLVLHPDEMDADLTDSVLRCAGGDSRMQSVKNGLLALNPFGIDHVLIHDGARPCVSDQIIQDVMTALRSHPAAAPAIAVTDALWFGQNDMVQDTRDRSGLYRAQTPQGFHFAPLLAAHCSQTEDATDDVEIARRAGLDVTITKGDEENIKITHPQDFIRAEQIMGRQMDIRLGNGYDVHRFGDGDHVILCGVQIPHQRGLMGHSDADVGMHAVTDAIYGALAQGDIGRHFPPTDPKWKGAASDIFLRHAAQTARDMGFGIGNIDCTLVCEYPKIGPHSDKMQNTLAKICEIDASRVSVKATTSEKLGFTGREEGIAALATVSVIKP